MLSSSNGWNIGLKLYVREKNVEDISHRITESFRLEKTLKIIKSNSEPNTANSTTKPCPLAPHLHVS